MHVLYRRATTEEVLILLRSIGWGLSDYLYANPDDGSKPAQTFQHMAPSDAFSLQSFSLVAAEWVEAGHRQIVVLNAPNHYGLVDEQVIGEALFAGAYSPGNLQYGSHVLIEHGPQEGAGVAHRVRLGQIIFQTLVCSGHCQIFSISRRPGKVLSVQDGCLYLHNYGPEMAVEPVGLSAVIRPAWAVNEQ